MVLGLRARSQPGQPDLTLPAEQTPAVVGRASSCPVRVADPSVSREHALIDFRGGRWVVVDRGSRHGTFVNGVRLTPEVTTEITPGDSIAFGPCVFVVAGRTGRDRRLSTSDDRAETNATVRSFPVAPQVSLDSMRLALLLDAAETFSNVTDEGDLANTVCEVLTRGTGLPRAILLRPGTNEGEFEILGSAGCEAGETPTISRSLLRAACSGQVASLDRLPDLAGAVSAVNLGLRAAIGVPVTIGGTVDAVLYLDARGRESAAHEDSTTFASAVARLCALAFGGLRRTELERRQGDLVRELNAARDVQTRLLPAPEGAHGRVRYAIRAVPGRFVAGDFVTVAPLADERVAFVIGDVAGKGAGPGLLMASILSFIHGEFSAGRIDIERLADNLNRYVAQRAHPSEFATMWMGLLEPRDGKVSYIDAGHGYALLARAGARAEPIVCEGAMPLGVVPDQQFVSETITINPGDRIVLYSDGVAEQRNAEGEMFQAIRAAEAVAGPATPAKPDAERLLEALTRFAPSGGFADDVTVASIELLTE